MPEVKPLKLTDLGGGAGRLEEFAAGDTLPKAALPTLAKDDVGLGNVDNTSDAAKPVSIAQQEALETKQDVLVSGVNLKTVNGESLLGTGDIEATGGGGGLTLFAESRHATGLNSTVPVHGLMPAGVETKVDFLIAPKGTGAIITIVPDGTATGGNKRGAGAVDLQLRRNQGSSSSVASGGYSAILGGGFNTASGYDSAVVGGNSNNAMGQKSVILGGTTNVAAGDSSAILGGGSHTASGVCAVVMGGTAGKASGDYSVAMGGSYNVASGKYSTAMGSGTSTRSVYGAIAEGASGSGAVQQMSRIPLGLVTANATTAQLTSDGGSPATTNTPVLPNNSAYYCRIRVLARNTTTNDSMSWTGTALIRRGANAATTTLVGSAIASDYGNAAMASCTVTLAADTTRGALAVNITGLADASVRWVAQVETVEAA